MLKGLYVTYTNLKAGLLQEVFLHCGFATFTSVPTPLLRLFLIILSELIKLHLLSLYWHRNRNKWIYLHCFTPLSLSKKVYFFVIRENSLCAWFQVTVILIYIWPLMLVFQHLLPSVGLLVLLLLSLLLLLQFLLPLLQHPVSLGLQGLLMQLHLPTHLSPMSLQALLLLLLLVGWLLTFHLGMRLVLQLGLRVQLQMGTLFWEDKWMQKGTACTVECRELERLKHTDGC